MHAPIAPVQCQFTDVSQRRVTYYAYVTLAESQLSAHNRLINYHNQLINYRAEALVPKPGNCGAEALPGDCGNDCDQVTEGRPVAVAGGAWPDWDGM